MRISDQQHRILDAVRRNPNGWACDFDFHAALFGKTWPREQRQIPPLTASQRASLSRSLRRLVSGGFLTRSATGAYTLPQEQLKRASG